MLRIYTVGIMEEKKRHTVGEAATLLKVSEETIRLRIKDESIRAELVDGKYVITELGFAQAQPPPQGIMDTYCGMPVDGDPTNENTIMRNP